MVTLGFFVILPLMWQLPICFITAELTTTFQVLKRPLFCRLSKLTPPPPRRELGMLDHKTPPVGVPKNSEPSILPP